MILGFAGVILLGALVLMLPIATVQRVWTPFHEALFTSTSAVCVTGLVVQDTGSYWSAFGQTVILLLIQIGGLGVITGAVTFLMLAGRNITLKERSAMQDAISAPAVGGIVRLTRFILKGTFLVELLGALALLPAFCRDYGLRGVWMSVFHSVSAFCNAGFSTFPMNLMEPGIRLCHTGQAVIMTLIVCGGLGFGIYKELYARLVNRFTARHRRLRMQWTPYFKLVMITTGILLVGGTLAIFTVSAPQASEPLAQHFWNCLFDSVTARTAGFNISDYSRYLPAASLIMCGLMVVGGSPGGTAGGMRTTTCAIAGAEILRILQGREHVEFFRRRIDQRTVARCVITVVVSCAWIGCFTILICSLEPALSSLDIFFENCSAFATVGVSRGITPHLGDPSKYLLIINMLAGRVGLFAFLIALAGTPTPRHYRYPSVKIPLT